MFLLEVRSSTKGVVCEGILWATLLEIHNLLIVGPWNCGVVSSSASLEI
jgi:hypothetical protein